MLSVGLQAGTLYVGQLCGNKQYVTKVGIFFNLMSLMLGLYPNNITSLKEKTRLFIKNVQSYFIYSRKLETRLENR